MSLAEPPRRVSVALDLWVATLALVLCWPLLSSGGYPFSRDLVFTPHLPFGPNALGLGSASARSAPLDAVVALLSAVVDGGLLAKVLVPGALLLAGAAAHRCVTTLGIPGRAATATFAVWNPFVVERLGLGQWALLYGYAGVLGIWAVARRGGGIGRAAPWLGLSAVTPTGALLGALALVTFFVRPGRRAVLVGGLAVLAQLPWALPALLGEAAATSAGAGVAAFAARSEIPGPPLLTLVGLGGIWDVLSVPGSRQGLLGILSAVLVTVALVNAATARGRAVLGRRAWVLAGGSFLLAAGATLPGLSRLLEWAMTAVPGAGLLRDGQKWLAPFVAVAAVAVGHLVQWAATRAPAAVRPSVVGLGLLAPLVLLPDATVVVHPVLTPVDYPTDYSTVAAAVNGTPGLLVSLPWELYRRYPWAGEYAAYDPSSRWFAVDVVTTDELKVGQKVVAGEDRRSTAVRAALSGVDPSGDLRRLGVRWVLLARTVDAQGRATIAEPPAFLRGRPPVVDGTALTLFELPGYRPPAGPSTWRLAVVLGADVGVLLLLAGLFVSSAGGRPRPLLPLRSPFRGRST